jgi:hypothetical protein
MDKVIAIIGTLGSIVAADGLYRYFELVKIFSNMGASSNMGSSFGTYYPYYMYPAMLIICVIGAVVLLASVFNKSHPALKWVMVILLAASSVLMFIHPSLTLSAYFGISLSTQIVGGLFVAVLAMVFVPNKICP